jgi:hypothetical protein
VGALGSSVCACEQVRSFTQPVAIKIWVLQQCGSPNLSAHPADVVMNERLHMLSFRLLVFEKLRRPLGRSQSRTGIYDGAWGHGECSSTAKV